ncbi:MAG: FG-GAP repeat protein [Myxococcota bacterium]|nr:FG-GAP repeat protein [Myxococcota bacterium]
MGSAAHVFSRSGTTWAEETTYVAPAYQENPGWVSMDFGWSVSVSADGTRMLVGAPSDNTARGSQSGSARVFVIE